MYQNTDPSLKVAFVFPGQGEQKHIPGTTKALLNVDPGAAATYEKAGRLLAGLDIPELCKNGTIEELSDPRNLQLATVVTSAAVFESLERRRVRPDIIFGHSLGEYPALFAARSITFDAMCNLVNARASYMIEASQENPGSMAALVWKLDEEQLEDIKRKWQYVKRICKEAGVEVAADNSFVTRTITGSKEAMARAKEVFKEIEESPEVNAIKGKMRWVDAQIPLPAHSKLMSGAALKMANYLTSVNVDPPQVPIIGNRTSRYFTSSNQIKVDLAYQLRGPVNYDRSVRYAIRQGAGAFLEVGAGKVLSGLNKQIMGDSVQIVTTEDYLKSIKDLQSSTKED